VWAIIISWLYFFIVKRCKLLRLKKAEEVIGMDAIMNAKNKGMDVSQLIEAV
jgi:ammonia channel protein AmtB